MAATATCAACPSRQSHCLGCTYFNSARTLGDVATCATRATVGITICARAARAADTCCERCAVGCSHHGLYADVPACACCASASAANCVAARAT